MFKSLKKVAGDEHSPKAEMVLNAPQNMDTSFENIHIETSPNKKHVSSTTLRYVTQNEKMPVEGTQNPQIGDVNHSETNTQDTLDKSDPRYIESLTPFYKKLCGITESIIKDETHHDKYTNDLKAEWCLTFTTQELWRKNVRHACKVCYTIGAENNGKLLAKCQDNTISREEKSMYQLLLSCKMREIIQAESMRDRVITDDIFWQILDRQERESKEEQGTKKSIAKNPEESPNVTIEVYSGNSQNTRECIKMTRTLYDKCTNLVDMNVAQALVNQYEKSNALRGGGQECAESSERPSSKGNWSVTALDNAKQDLETLCIIL